MLISLISILWAETEENWMQKEIIEALQNAQHLKINWNGWRCLLVKYFESGAWERVSFDAFIHQLKFNKGGLLQGGLF